MLFTSTSNKTYYYDANSNSIIDISILGQNISSDIENQTIPDDLKGELLKFGILFPVSARIVSPTNPEFVHECVNSHLQTLILSVTEQCNMRCSYCIYSGTYKYERTHSARMMSLDTAKQSIDLFAARSKEGKCRFISFYGGEPLLNWGLIEQGAEYASTKKLNAGFHVTTNGSLLNKDKISFLIKKNFSLMVSLDGPPEVHDKYRRFKDGGPTHKRVLSALRLVRDTSRDYFNSMLSIVATLAPPYPLKQIADYFSNEPIFSDSNILVNFIVPYDNTLLEALTQDDRDEYMRSYAQQYQQLKLDFIQAGICGTAHRHFGKHIFSPGLSAIVNRAMFPPPEQSPNGCCIPGMCRLFVDAQGGLSPCEKVGSCMRLGTLEEPDYYRKSLGYLQQYAADCRDNCRSCFAVRFCDLCFVNAKNGTGLDFNRKKISCSEKKSYLRDCLEIFCSIKEYNDNGLSSLDRDMMNLPDRQAVANSLPGLRD